jgi:hypothetical protein
MARSRNAPERRSRRKPPFIDTLPALLVSALAEKKDFILCFETDEESGTRSVHAMTGQFISPCMLRKLIGQAESQKDEGAVLISRAWR